MIGSRFISCYMTEVSGNCVICAKPVTKRLPNGTAKRMKHLLCGGYRCKMALAAIKTEERKERAETKKVCNE